MHPILFRLGPLPITTYGILEMIGFAAAIFWAVRRARKSGADEEIMLNVGILALVFGLLGCRVFYVIHNWRLFMAADNPILAILDVTSGGFEFYGGFLAASAATVLYLWTRGKSLRWYMDIIAPSVMVGSAFGRIGCFFVGCCWGVSTPLPVGVHFPYGSQAFDYQWRQTHEVRVPAELILVGPTGQPQLVPTEFLEMTDEQLAEKLARATPNTSQAIVLKLYSDHLKSFNLRIADLRRLVQDLDLHSGNLHPTQLYSAINSFLIAWILGVYFWRRTRDGMVVAWLFVLYPIARFLEEMIRADNPHDTFGFTISQGISLAVIPLALAFMLLLRFLPPRSPRALAELERKKNPPVARPVNLAPEIAPS